MLLINLINEEIKEIDKKIISLNKNLLDYKPVYDALKPKGKKFKKENIINLSFNDELLDKLTSLVSKTNLIAVEKMLEYKVLFENHDKEVNKKLRAYGLSKNIIFSDNFLNTINARSKNNPRLKPIYEKLIEMKKRDEELFLINEKIVMYVAGVMIDLYESTLNEKENLKQTERFLSYTIKDIKQNNKLIPRNLSLVLDLINKQEDEKLKQTLLKELNDYLLKIENRPKEELSEKESKVKQKVTYFDNDLSYDEKQEDIEDLKEENYICENYLAAIKYLKEPCDIYTFLDSIKHDYNIKIILNRIINLLSDSKEDLNLKNIITNYLYKLEDEKEEVNKKDNNENIIFYYGFLERKNKIYQDIIRNNIPNEYYHDILYGLNLIKKDGAKEKRTSITKLRKVFKLRVKDIRITYRLLKDNVYIILGVFCKKDHKGFDVINKTENRNNKLVKIEKSLVSSLSINELFDEYEKENAFIEDEIKTLLNTKRK